VNFSFKICYLVAEILVLFMKINLPKSVNNIYVVKKYWWGQNVQLALPIPQVVEQLPNLPITFPRT